MPLPFRLAPPTVAFFGHLLCYERDSAYEGSEAEAMARILVIDDDELFREFVQKALADAGFEVIGAAGGDEGLRKFTETPVDLVVCDVLMPDKDGLETIRAIRSISARLPIITVTGGILAETEDGLDDLRMSMAFGATCTIGKPFRAAKLLKLVRDCLGERAGPAGD
jgi:DNA-binding response OmpR family regulator